jgi:hypothetical protein
MMSCSARLRFRERGHDLADEKKAGEILREVPAGRAGKGNPVALFIRHTHASVRFAVKQTSEVQEVAERANAADLRKSSRVSSRPPNSGW